MEKAIDRFIGLTAENTKMLEKLTSHMEDHMETNPDNINWANVGDAGRVNEGLKDITEFLGIK